MKKFLIPLVIGFLLLGSNAWAATFEFDDTWVNWNDTTSDSSQDLYGYAPQIEKMMVTLDDNNQYLQSVQIQVEDGSDWQEYNSLFINSYNDSDPTQWDEWDYFVHDGEDNNYKSNWVKGNVPTTDGIYTVNSYYEYTTTKNNSWVKSNQPNGIDENSLSLAFNEGSGGSGWVSNDDLTLFTYTFADQTKIDLSSGFFIAFAPFCANDVIGGGQALNPVPEPATMALFAMGLIGLAGVGRKRYKK